MPSGIYVRTKEQLKNQSLSHLGKNVGHPFYGGTGNKGHHYKIKDTSKMNKDKIGKKRPDISEIMKVVGKLNKGKRWEWKNHKIEYRALHYWVRKNLGEPIKCEHCGKEKTTPKNIHWANISHKYLKIITDWISLCVPCHKKYDRDYNYRRNTI